MYSFIITKNNYIKKELVIEKTINIEKLLFVREISNSNSLQP